MVAQPGQVETKPETRRLLTAADYFLRDRNFADCQHYALRARDSDPINPGPNRILAIAATLSAPRHDNYAVLGLPHFEPDASRICSSFRTLASNLNPNVNPYPLAAEAMDLVLRAWSVLSNSREKAAFDQDLRRILSPSAAGTFWTICPYCYHVYEYESVYEDCCLKCSNEKCRRVLHAVAIQAPPPDVVEKGQYWCAGFMLLGICDTNAEEVGDKSWAPFGKPPAGSPGRGVDQKLSCNGEGVVVDTSDEERRAQNDGKRMEMEVDVKNNISGVKVSNGVRMKSVPWNSKKMMGRGVIICENPTGVGGEGDGNLNSNENDLEVEVGGDVSNGVEFFEGDDDVLIDLPRGYDLGNGDTSV